MALGRIIATLLYVVDQVLAGFWVAGGSAAQFDNTLTDCGLGAYTVTPTACGGALINELQTIIAALVGIGAGILPALNVG